ncbi:MAG: M48 family metalloprotease [Mariniphaga sp.]|nr:M48 family metalloprotease [Mariniphaga sp.]
MNHKAIRIPLEIQIGQELYQQIQGKVLESILREAKVEKTENYFKNILQGHSFKVNEKLAPRLYESFLDVKLRLGFEEPIEFYITNNPELNAFAVSRLEVDESHIININSGLIDKVDDDELKFIVGHEIGHLISNNANIAQLLNFVFQDQAQSPLMMQHKIAVWDKLSELTADRFGFIACGRLDKVLSCFFKMASGLSVERLNFDPKAFSLENEEILKYFKETGSGNLLSHPINPIRIKAVELFETSDLYRNLLAGTELREDKKLDTQVSELIQSLMVISNSPVNFHRISFIASAGLIVAGIDKAIEPDEYKKIIEELSAFTVFPKQTLKQMIDDNKMEEFFENSVKALLEINPGEKNMMMEYMINIIIADSTISEGELNFIFDFGVKLGFERKEIAQIFASSIQEQFIPNIYL